MNNAPTNGFLMRGAISPRHGRFLKSMRLRKIWLIFAQCAVLVAFFGLWQFAAASRLVDPFIISHPVAIAKKIVELIQDGSLARHVGITLVETLLAFGLGTVMGIVLAAMFWWWDFLSDVADPYVVILNATPKIALGPVFIVWLGANTGAVIALAVSITLFVAILSVYSAFRQVDRQKLMLVAALGGTKWQQFQKVVFPSSIPTIISTLKVNIGLALTGTIVGEFLAANAGLGYLIIYGQNIFNMTLVMTSLVILTFIAAVMYYAVCLVERQFNPANGT
ncbi:MAG: binding-protein-dependent transport system inner rane component [Herminiimonas sp.]|nr:binding-protein-dependent transport system inner rane component [Herminiimonas sp.]